MPEKRELLAGTTAGATQTRLIYNLSDGAEYIDIAHGLSLANHRLYRQGNIYFCNIGLHKDAAGTVVDDATVPGQTLVRPSVPTGDIQIDVIPNTWVTRKAWKMGKHYWREHTRAEQKLLVEQGGGVARWYDYKVEHTVGAGASLTPSGVTSTGSEWVISQMRTSGGVDATFAMLGAHSAPQYGLVTIYDNLADAPDDEPEKRTSTFLAFLY